MTLTVSEGWSLKEKLEQMIGDTSVKMIQGCAFWVVLSHVSAKTQT